MSYYRDFLEYDPADHQSDFGENTMNVTADKQPKIVTEIAEIPLYPGEWSIDQIISKLKRPLPDSITETRKQKGKEIPFIPWHQVNRILDKYAIGWTWRITNMVTTDDRIFITGRLTIPTASGNIYREATGTEQLKETTRDGEIREISYGDPSSNAESMAFRRSAARFGLGLYLYDK